MDWELLHTFEAVARVGSLTEAAKFLGISQSTVSRQLKKLEEEGGAPLLIRHPRVRLTQRGQALFAALKPMVDGALAAQAALDEQLELRGEVIVSTTGELLRWALIHRLSAFYEDFPALRLRILADNQTASLASGVADIALRWFKPVRGELVVRRLMTESFAFFAAAELPLSASMPWLGLTGSLKGVPEERHAARAFAGRPPRLLLEDVEALGLAVQAGLGVAILPHSFAAKLGGLVEVQPCRIGAQEMGEIPSRDLWLVIHRSKQNLPNVRAAIGWIEETLGKRG